MQITPPECRYKVERFHRGWNRNQKCRKGEHRAKERVHTGHKHMVTPNDGREKGDGHDRPDHRPVTKYRLTGIGGYHLRGDTKRRQKDDIYFRMPQEPEQVFEKNRRSSFVMQYFSLDKDVLKKERRSKTTVKQKQQCRRQQHGEGDHTDHRRDEESPNRQRKTRHPHPFGPQVQHRDDVVERPHKRRRNENRHRYKPKRHSQT